ncbi:MAG: SHOCT domain-containing protein [Chloroflexota bacterium]
MMGSFGAWDMGFGSWLGVIGGLVFVIGLIVLVVWAVTNAGRRPDDSIRPAGKTPLDILRERYARGEITADEFEQAKRILGY